MQRQRRSFGKIRKLPSGRYQASYVGPDMVRHNAHATFTAKMDAEGWLHQRRREIETGDSQPDSSKPQPVTFGEYSATWLERRKLKPRTREHYQHLLDRRIWPTFAKLALQAITSDAVADWHHRQGQDTPTAVSHAYSLLRTILGDAERDGHISRNPCHIRGASNAKRQREIRPATAAELATIVEHMPEKYRLLVVVSAWCGLRFGEVTELRRKDFDLSNGVIKVRRAVTRVKGEHIVSTPKSDAGTRDVAIPPHIMPMVRDHLSGNITGGKDGLLFPAADGVSHLPESSLYKVFRPAREAAGRPDLRVHDLRHGAAVMAAQSGATLAELMNRLGHSTPAAAMRYQHASSDRDQAIAAKLSEMAGSQ